MAPSKIRRAIGHVKDQTSISLAKVSSSSSVSDLEVAIVKATRHKEYPAEERHIREILSLTSYSRAHISVCVKTLAKRLNKTRNWTVALKTLMLIQRLLSEGDPAYEQEIFFSTRHGTRILNLSDFCDTSQSNSWDFSAFVRTYALYLDERLEFMMEGRYGRRRSMHEEDHEDNDDIIAVRSVPVAEMKDDPLFSRLLHLQQLLDRFIACRPIGHAKCNMVVTMALHPLVKESFQLYYDITEILGVLIDRFMDLDVSDSIKVYNIFCREKKQFEELEIFYSWCKSVGISRSSDYPEIEKLTQKKLDLIDEFIREKSAVEQAKIIRDELGIGKHIEPSEEEEEEDDKKAIKALPAPDTADEEQKPEKKEEEEDNSKALVVEPKGDLLNLGEEAVSSQDYGDKLALALFDGCAPAVVGCAPSSDPGWEAFKDEADWESALVQSASNLKKQRATLGGGFDVLLLDSMYQQGTTTATMGSSGYSTTGSASSIAFGSTGRPATLALPAPPPSSKNIGINVFDPFAASLTVEPPAYVQMSDMEKKQRFLAEEQTMWEQYRRGGMQGYGAMSKVHNYPYGSGGYTVWHGY